MLKKRVYREYFLPGLSGLLIIFSQPPFPFFFLAYVCLVPLLFCLNRDGRKSDFLYGLKTGIVAYTGIIYWVVIAMNKYGGIDILSSILCMLLLSLYLSIYLATFTFLISFFDSRLSLPIYLSSPFIWTLLEYLRTFLLSGFPWALIAYSQYSFIYLIQVSALIGPYYMSFLIVLVNCGIYLLLKERLSFFKVPKLAFFLSSVAVIFIGTLTYGFFRIGLNFDDSTKKNVALIQASVRQDIKWTEEYKMASVQTHMSKSLETARKADLIIWPETALPYVLEENIGLLKCISGFAKYANVPILTGALSRDEKGKLYNAAYLFDRYGEIKGIYKKVHLVPFGEYTPLVHYLPFMENISVSGEDFSPGSGHYPLFLPELGEIGVLICYEGIFPHISRETVKNGAKVIVNLTNDAWYDKSSAPYQHFAFYVFRAVETGRFVVRCANTGISAIIDPKGKVVMKTSLFKEETLLGQISLRSEETLYVKWGDYFIFVISFTLGGMITYKLFPHKKLRK
ncbi:MAG: apolipoprotein N-acyltransferase [Deltaproteobacteria bacterium]|nr:apolipoprotein N-acyltransferase [Deltaproteobacteria bacterium]